MSKVDARNEIIRIIKEELPKVKVTCLSTGEYKPATKADKALSIKWSSRIAELMGILGK